jgi:hypothetical protein
MATESATSETGTADMAQRLRPWYLSRMTDPEERWAKMDAQVADLAGRDPAEAIRRLLRLVAEQREEVFYLEHTAIAAYRWALWAASQFARAVLRSGLGGELETARAMEIEVAHRRRDAEECARCDARRNSAYLEATKRGRPEDFDAFTRRLAAGEFEPAKFTAPPPGNGDGPNTPFAF